MKLRFPRAISFLSERYKNRLWRCIGLSTLALLSESIGILSILPIIVVVLGQQDGTAASDPMFQKVEAVLSSLSIPINLPLLLVIFFSGILLKACLNLWSLQQAGYAAAAVARDIRSELTSGLMQASWPHFINLRIGEITNLIVGEPDRVAYSFPALVKFVAAIFQVLLYSTLSFYASPAVAITALIIGSVIFLCLRRLIRIHQHVATEQAKERGRLADRVTQILNGFKIIKAMALEPWVQPLLTEGTEKLGTLYRKEVLSKAALQSVFEPTFALCLCLGIIIFTVIYPQPLAQLMFMAILLHRLMSHTSTLQASYQNLTGYDGIIDQYLKHKDSLFAAAEEDQSAEPLPHWNDLAFENISFSYGDTPVLKNINTRFPASSLTVILGLSGAGKSTLLDVLAGLQKPTGGQILLDRVPLPHDRLYSYRKHLGYLPQEPILLNDTIRRNITLGDPQFSDGDLAEALKNAGLAKTVASFPEGMETIVGERGGRLSGGQRQRLMLARALIRKPALLLLDEPLSALDADTARALCNTLGELKKHLSIVAVSHQQDILRVADHVYEMDKGQIRKK